MFELKFELFQTSISNNAGHFEMFEIIQTVDKVRDIVNIAQKTFPKNVTISYSQDSSKYIKNMLNSFQNNVVGTFLTAVMTK